MDGRFQLKRERSAGGGAFVESIRSALAAEGVPSVEVTVRPGATERVVGDLDRLRQVFVHLAAYVPEGRDANGASIRLGHEGASLEARSSYARGALLDWRLDLLAGLSEIAPDQVSAEALRPLMARDDRGDPWRPDSAPSNLTVAGSSASPFRPNR